MPQVRFEPTIPVFERAKTVHALDRATSVTGHRLVGTEIFIFFPLSCHESAAETFLVDYKYFKTFPHANSLILS
jgi:hypothetical protein